jgi:hypothetical protein
MAAKTAHTRKTAKKRKPQNGAVVSVRKVVVDQIAHQGIASAVPAKPGAAAEIRVRTGATRTLVEYAVTRNGRTVYEWRLYPDRPGSAILTSEPTGSTGQAFSQSHRNGKMRVFRFQTREMRVTINPDARSFTEFRVITQTRQYSSNGNSSDGDAQVTETLMSATAAQQLTCVDTGVPCTIPGSPPTAGTIHCCTDPTSGVQTCRCVPIDSSTA